MKSEENILYNGRHSGVQTQNEALSTYSKHVQAFVFENCKSKDQLVLFELRFKMGKYVNIYETSFQKLKILTINDL
jgi:hypothetical protein